MTLPSDQIDDTEDYIDFSPKQIDFLLNSDAFINICSGAVRSGKSHICNLRWLEYITSAPKGDLLMVGKTIRTLERNVLKAENGIFDLIGEGNYHYNSSTGELTINGRNIYCVGANDEKSENKIRGMTLVGAYCDEVTLYPESFIQQLIQRHSKSMKRSKMFWSTNPDSPYHFIKTDYIDDMDKRDIVKTWNFLMTDNPFLVKFNAAYIEMAKKWKGVYYKRNFLGEFALAEGLVYENFSDDCIVDELPDKFDKIFIGGDHGVNHPTTYVMIGLCGDKVYLIKEYKKSGLRNTQLTADLVEFIGNTQVNGMTIDSAAASFILDVKKAGIHLTECDKSVEDGIARIGTLIAENRFFVHRRCVNAIKEFYSYSWDSKKSQNSGKDVVVKLNDDILDALRYACTTFLLKQRPKPLNRNVLF